MAWRVTDWEGRETPDWQTIGHRLQIAVFVPLSRDGCGCEKCHTNHLKILHFLIYICHLVCRTKCEMFDTSKETMQQPALFVVVSLWPTVSCSILLDDYCALI